jgi:hypothetical protein
LNLFNIIFVNFLKNLFYNKVFVYIKIHSIFCHLEFQYILKSEHIKCIKSKNDFVPESFFKISVRWHCFAWEQKEDIFHPSIIVGKIKKGFMKNSTSNNVNSMRHWMTSSRELFQSLPLFSFIPSTCRRTCLRFVQFININCCVAAQNSPPESSFVAFSHFYFFSSRKRKNIKKIPLNFWWNFPHTRVNNKFMINYIWKFESNQNSDQFLLTNSI